MNVVISQEHRFDRTPDGAVWTQAAFPRSYFSQYLEVFESARVLARVRDVAAPLAGAKRADGDGVCFHPVPHYIGPEQYLKQWRHIAHALRGAVTGRDAVILRVQSQIAAGVEPMLHRKRHPYGLEVMCDPYEMFARGANNHPLRGGFQLYFYRQMKKQCGRAPAVSYVTEESLQRRYPCSPQAITACYSTVELADDAFVREPRRFSLGRDFSIVTVGSLDQPYKGVDTLIDSMAQVRLPGQHLRLVVIGDGRYRDSLEALANRNGISAQFLGQVTSGSAVRDQLDRADLFVLPSRAEGLPRAMMEAMARALPCIGSTIGGIPELLDSGDMVPPAQVAALAAKLHQVLTAPGRLEAMSARNLAASRRYHAHVLRGRKLNYYRDLKRLTEAWQGRAADSLT